MQIWQEGREIEVTKGYIADLLWRGLRPQDWELLDLVADFRGQTIPQIIADAVALTTAEPPGRPLDQQEIDQATLAARLVIHNAHAILNYWEARAA